MHTQIDGGAKRTANAWAAQSDAVPCGVALQPPRLLGGFDSERWGASTLGDDDIMGSRHATQLDKIIFTCRRRLE